LQKKTPPIRVALSGRDCSPIRADATTSTAHIRVSPFYISPIFVPAPPRTWSGGRAHTPAPDQYDELGDPANRQRHGKWGGRAGTERPDWADSESNLTASSV